MVVEIREDEVKTATALDTILYPSLSSCMSITCVLNDGSKVGAHAYQFGDSGTTLTNRMIALIGTTTVTSVKAKGHGGCWGTNLQSQFDLAPTAIQNWRNANPNENRDPTDLEIRPFMQALFITANTNTFTNWLNAQFGVQNATFSDMDADGDVNVNAAGNLV